MRGTMSGFLALLLAVGSIGCDSLTTPEEADILVVTSEEHVVEVVSHDGAPSRVEVTIPFTIENRSQAPVYLAINCLDQLWAWVYKLDGGENVEPSGLCAPFVADCGAGFVTIEPGRSFDSSVSLSGPFPSSPTLTPFPGSYRVVVDDLFAEPVEGLASDARDALLLPEDERSSNTFTLRLGPQ